MILACQYSDIGDWTYDDFYRVEDEAIGDGYLAMMTGLSAEVYLTAMVNAEMYGLFNVVDKTVAFDSDRFVNILEWAHHNGANEQIGNPYMGYSEAVHIQQSSCCSMSEYYGSSAIVMTEETRANRDLFVGYPSEEGEILVAVPHYTFAITRNCSRVEDVSDLLKMSLEPLMQDVYSRLYLPITTEGFDNYLSAIQNSDDRRWLEDLNSRINSVHQNEPELMQVILEEAQAYFAGQKTAQEVARLIQGRAELIMSEKYG